MLLLGLKLLLLLLLLPLCGLHRGLLWVTCLPLQLLLLWLMWLPLLLVHSRVVVSTAWPSCHLSRLLLPWLLLLLPPPLGRWGGSRLVGTSKALRLGLHGRQLLQG